MDQYSDWQHPFVDVFKKYDTFDAPRSYKGSVNIIHVLDNLHRILLLPGNVLNYLDQSYPIIQSQSLILQLIQNTVT